MLNRLKGLLMWITFVALVAEADEIVGVVVAVTLFFLYKKLFIRNLYPSLKKVS